MEKKSDVNLDEFVKGELTPEEIMQLGSLREAANRIIRELGEAELRRAKLIGQFQVYEDRAAAVLQSVRERLGILDGQAWQVSPDNKIRVIPTDKVDEIQNDSGLGSNNG